MNDQEALKVLSGHPKSIDEYTQALFVAIKRLKECQWYPYDPDTFADVYRPSFGMKVILGIRYADGSCGSVDGIVVYDPMKQWRLAVACNCRNTHTDSAVIEKWMPYPDYNGDI